MEIVSSKFYTLKFSLPSSTVKGFYCLGTSKNISKLGMYAFNIRRTCHYVRVIEITKPLYTTWQYAKGPYRVLMVTIKMLRSIPLQTSLSYCGHLLFPIQYNSPHKL